MFFTNLDSTLNELFVHRRNRDFARCHINLLAKLTLTGFLLLNELLHSQTEHLHIERLRDVVIRTNAQAFHLQLVAPTSCQENDGNMRPSQVCLDTLAEFQTVHLRHRHVTHHQINAVVLLQTLQCHLTVISSDDIIFTSEIIMHETAHVRTVVHHQHGEAFVRLTVTRCLLCPIRNHRCRIVIINSNRLRPLSFVRCLLSVVCCPLSPIWHDSSRNLRHHSIHRRDHGRDHITLHTGRQHIHLVQQQLGISQNHLYTHPHIVSQWFSRHLL